MAGAPERERTAGKPMRALERSNAHRPANRPSRWGARGVLLRSTALLGALGTLAIPWWWSHPADPVRELREHASPLVSVDRVRAPDLGSRYERWRLVDGRGDSAHAIWRRAPAGAERPWTVVLLGGLETGRRSVLLIPEAMPVCVLAVDWPWTGERRLGIGRAVLLVPAIRRALLRAPSVLALGLEAADRQPEVDRDRVVLIGASLGVPPALAALRLTNKPRAVVILFGSAKLGEMFELGLRREIRPGWLGALLAPPLAVLCERQVHSLEPLLHADELNRLPALMICVDNDEFLPRGGVEALRRAIPHATRVELGGSHLRAHDRAGADSLSGRVAAWLEKLPERARADAASGPR